MYANAQWAGAQRVWLVARKRDAKELRGDPSYRLIGESAGHYLFSNQP